MTKKPIGKGIKTKLNFNVEFGPYVELLKIVVPITYELVVLWRVETVNSGPFSWSCTT